jgi:hypothetical protein
MPQVSSESDCLMASPQLYESPTLAIDPRKHTLSLQARVIGCGEAEEQVDYEEFRSVHQRPDLELRGLPRQWVRTIQIHAMICSGFNFAALWSEGMPPLSYQSWREPRDQ